MRFNLSETAHEVGVSPEAVRQWLQSGKVPGKSLTVDGSPVKRYHFTKSNVNVIKAMIRAGELKVLRKNWSKPSSFREGVTYNTQQVANYFNVRPGTVLHWCQKHGISKLEGYAHSRFDGADMLLLEQEIMSNGGPRRIKGVRRKADKRKVEKANKKEAPSPLTKTRAHIKSRTQTSDTEKVIKGALALGIPAKNIRLTVRVQNG